MVPEIHLIEKLKNGEEQAFEYLFKSYYSMLTVFAKKYLYDIEIAKEIVQELFVKIYENRNTLEIKTSLKSYLFKSVHNRCLTYISQNESRSKHLEQIKILNRGQEFEEFRWIEQTELEDKVYKSIALLPDQCQRIFKMNRLEGKKNKEIAEELGISIRTVETQISKALKILREKLTQYVALILIICVFL